MDNAAKTPLEEVPALAQLLRTGGEEQTLGALAGLLDSLPVGVALVDGRDDQLRLLYLNSPAQRFASHPREAVLGQPAARALDHPEVLRALRDARKDRGPRRVRYQTAEGLWDFQATSLDAGSGQPARLLATWEQAHEEAAAVDAAIDAADSLEPANVMERTLRRAADEAGADLVLLLRREDDELVQEAGFDRASRNGHLQPIPLAMDQASRLALEFGEPVLRSPEPLSDGAAPGSGLRAVLHSARIPLQAEREPSSLLLLLGRRRGAPFTSDDAALLEVLAHHAAIAIRNAGLYERAQKTARRLQVGVDVALEVAARLEPEEVVERILRRALEAVEADRATLGRMESGFECTILGSVDRTEDQAPIGRTISLESQDPVVEAMATRRPVLGHLAYERVGMRPLRWDLVIPLVVGGELVALLGVSRDRRQFDEDEIAVLQQIGAVAALAFRNATLFQSLREAGRIRSQFLNMAAHELRTPLSVIGGYVSMLADGTLGEAPSSWRMPLAVVVEKTKELAHLIDDILLAGRLDSGQARTPGRSMDLSAALRDATQRAAARARLLDANLKVEQPKETVQVWGDPDHVARILDNLVNNAFNYSPKEAEVRITSEIGDDWAVVRVEDHGRGISEEHRDHIFQQFYRVEDSKDGYPPGTGLGLFISRALAERYGGNLDLEWSEPGQGSRFALRLPLFEAAA